MNIKLITFKSYKIFLLCQLAVYFVMRVRLTGCVAWMEETRNIIKFGGIICWKTNMAHNTVKQKSGLNGNPPLLKNVSGPKSNNVKM